MTAQARNRRLAAAGEDDRAEREADLHISEAKEGRALARLLIEAIDKEPQGEDQ